MLTTRTLQRLVLSPIRDQNRAIAFGNFAAGRLDAYTRGDCPPARQLAYHLSQIAIVDSTYYATEVIILARAVMRAMSRHVSSVEIAEAIDRYVAQYLHRA